MREILQNLALMNTVEFCLANGIDCSGSHIVKHRRGFVYRLVRDADGLPLVTVTFHKAHVPTYIKH